VLRGRIASYTTAADKAAAQHDALLAEQQLHANMPDEQRTLEQTLRMRAAA
jgi:hypothetical protein